MHARNSPKQLPGGPAPIERINTQSRENVVDGAGLADPVVNTGGKRARAARVRAGDELW